MRNLVWLKSDLRVHDNPALTRAMASGETAAVYVICQAQWQKHGISSAKQSLMLRQLMLLYEALQRLNVPLVIVNGGQFDDLPGELEKLVHSLSIGRVLWNKELEYNEHSSEGKVAERLNELGVHCEAFDDACLVRPGTVLNVQGEQYKVFSAFKKRLLSAYQDKIRSILPKPAPQTLGSAELALQCASLSLSLEAVVKAEAALNLSGHYGADMLAMWPAGEDEAHHRLETFFESRVQRYHQDRDIPSIEGTSQISPYLAIGAISSRQCWSLVERASLLSPEASEGIAGWSNEILWREFYKHLLVAQPELCKFKPFKAETDQLAWKHDQALFDAWKDGRTGYPIVDAGMRQLNQTGWMHNRLRMVTAMFLTKHLFVDWRWGEAYFMSKLIDGDLAANNGGWQWSASTGVDAVPYFRIFNPVRQSQRFDPDGVFIKQFVPELAGLDHRAVHMPTSGQALAAGYVLPLVNHQEAVSSTKSAFSALNTGSNGDSISQSQQSRAGSPQMELNCL